MQTIWRNKLKDNFDLQNEDRFNWGLIVGLLGCAYYWVNVYYYGFFVTTMWTLVIAAIIALWLKLTDRI